MTVKIFKQGKALGPGIVTLLRLIDETRSIRKSAQIMGMAYSKAWRILNECEETFEKPLVLRTAGGKCGGGAELTKFGHDMLNRYSLFMGELDSHASRLFQKYFRSTGSHNPEQ